MAKWISIGAGVVWIIGAGFLHGVDHGVAEACGTKPRLIYGVTLAWPFAAIAIAAGYKGKNPEMTVCEWARQNG